MASETIEQLRAHRDQLKAENDRLNPENDQFKQTVANLNKSLADANAASARATVQGAAALAERAIKGDGGRSGDQEFKRLARGCSGEVEPGQYCTPDPPGVSRKVEGGSCGRSIRRR